MQRTLRVSVTTTTRLRMSDGRALLPHDGAEALAEAGGTMAEESAGRLLTRLLSRMRAGSHRRELDGEEKP
jgi:hypothetical protein